MVDGSAAKPLAEGTLETTPLAHVILHIATNRLSGTLFLGLDDGSAEDRVHFDHGRPVAARLLSPASSLERGLLSLFLRTKAPYRFYAENLLGDEVSLVMGIVDPRALIAAALRTGACDGPIDDVLAKLGTQEITIRERANLGAFSFLPAERTLVDTLCGRVLTPPVFLASASDRKVARRVLYVLAITRCLDAGRTVRSSRPPPPGARPPASGTPSSPPRVSPPPSVGSTPPPGAKAGTSQDPPPTTVGVPRPPPAVKPAASIPAPKRTTDPPSPREAPRGKGRRVRSDPPPAPEQALSKEELAWWNEIVSRVQSIENEDFFTMLGVPRSAGELEVRGAYFELVKKWHPDRVPLALKPLSKWVDRVFGYLSEARETLSVDDRRKRYMQHLQDGGGTPAASREIEDIVHAAGLFQKVEVLVRQREWKDALATLDEAIERNDEEGDYRAMRSWILFHLHVGDDAPAAEILEGFEYALSQNEKNERVHYHMGVVLKRFGRVNESRKHFGRAAELNPKNVDAVREVRLAQMRAGSAPTAEGIPQVEGSGGGLLGRLFGGKKSKSTTLPAVDEGEGEKPESK